MYVRKNGAAAIREIVKQSEELASLVVEASGLGFLIDYMGDCHGNARLPTIMALGKKSVLFLSIFFPFAYHQFKMIKLSFRSGFIGSYSETLAMSVLRSNGATVLKDALVNEPEDHIKVRKEIGGKVPMFRLK